MFCTHAFGIRNEDLIGLKGSNFLLLPGLTMLPPTYQHFHQ